MPVGDGVPEGGLGRLKGPRLNRCQALKHQIASGDLKQGQIVPNWIKNQPCPKNGLEIARNEES